MSWNGSGTFTRTNGVFSGSGVWASDAAVPVKILASRHDTHDQDLAAGINACLAKNGENTPTANLPMGSFIHTGVGDASARTHYGKVSQIQDSVYTYATGTYSSAVYTISYSPALPAYVDGQLLTFLPDTNNDAGNAFVNINGLGNIKIYDVHGGDKLPPGRIVANIPAIIIYRNSKFHLVNPQVSVNTSLAAAGSDQAGATEIDAQFSDISSGSGGVKLVDVSTGSQIFINNGSGGDVTVYPELGGQFRGFSVNQGITLASNIDALYLKVGSVWVQNT